MPTKLNHGGHGKSYWKKSDYSRGTEFFAEAFSAKALGKDNLAVLKKYFPKTMEIFEEILERSK